MMATKPSATERSVELVPEFSARAHAQLAVGAREVVPDCLARDEKPSSYLDVSGALGGELDD